MGLAQAREVVYQHFVSEWNVANGSFCLDEEIFNPPTAAVWLRVVVRMDQEMQDTLGQEGNRRFRSYGRVLVQVFGPPASGTRAIGTAADLVAAVFRGKRLSGTVAFISGVSITEMPTVNGFAGMLVNAPFEFDLVA